MSVINDYLSSDALDFLPGEGLSKLEIVKSNISEALKNRDYALAVDRYLKAESDGAFNPAQGREVIEEIYIYSDLSFRECIEANIRLHSDSRFIDGGVFDYKNSLRRNSLKFAAVVRFRDEATPENDLLLQQSADLPI